MKKRLLKKRRKWLDALLKSWGWTLVLLVLMPLVALAEEAKPKVPTGYSHTIIVPARKVVKAESDEPPQRVRVLGPSLQQPSPDHPIVVPAGRFVALSSPNEEPSYVAPQAAYRIYRVNQGGSFIGIKFDAAENAEPESYAWTDESIPVIVLLAREAPGLYSLQLLKNGPSTIGPVENGKPFAIQIVSGIGPRPPPIPPGPTPPVPPDPVPPTPPAPVTSFRVIFVKESGTTLSAAQTAIPGAKAVRDYLFSKTTRENGVTGWREYDPQVDVTNEQPTMKALWEAVKPGKLPDGMPDPKRITVVPCIVVEKNGKAEILPYPTNAAEALTVLKTYGGP